jgi:hypothetical protein
MKKILITILLFLNFMIYWKDGILKIQSGSFTIAQAAQQVANYLNSQNNGNIYTYNGGTNMVFQHNGSGGMPTVIHPNTINIPGGWSWNGPAIGPGFTNWLNNLSGPLAAALNDFLSSGGGGGNGGGSNGSGGGEDEGEEWPNNGWEPMPDGFGYDPTDPNSVDNLMNDPMFNPNNDLSLSPWDLDIFTDLDMYFNLYSGNFTVDCTGLVNGSAYTDSCGICVGGNTGLTACLKDCEDVWGGGSFIDSCGLCVKPPRKQPCDTSYKKIGDSLYNNLYRPEFADSLNKLISMVDTAGYEKTMSLGKDSLNGNYKATAIKSGDSSAAVQSILQYPGIKVYNLIHTHTDSVFACFSNSDFYNFVNINLPQLNQINSQYVISADTTVYLMAVENVPLYNLFLAIFPYDSIKGGGYGGYNDSLPLGKVFKEAYRKLAASENLGGTLSDEDAFDQAQAFAFSKYNSGTILYRKRKNETKFTKLNTQVSKNAANQDVFTPYNCL